MLTEIKAYCDALPAEFGSIPAARRQLLERIAAYVKTKLEAGLPANLVYICTHNSRRSHFGQVWAKVASEYYGLKTVHTFSGGTEATAFNGHAIRALERIGFRVSPPPDGQNNRYQVVYDAQKPALECFSKVYNAPENPQQGFAAIMTCSDAEENCPFIPGVELRIGTTYNDPKAFDNTPQQDAKYDERCRQIALETFYAMSKV